MLKRQFLVVLVLVAVALVLSSCNFTPVSSVVHAETTTPMLPPEPEEVYPTNTPTPLTQKGIVAIINLWHDWQGVNEEVLNKVLAKFKEEYPTLSLM